MSDTKKVCFAKCKGYCFCSESTLQECMICQSYGCDSHVELCSKCKCKLCIECYYNTHKKSRLCEQCLLYGKLKKDNDKMLADIDNINSRLDQMMDLLQALVYAPQGPKYQEAKTDFDTQLSNKKN